MDGTSFFFRQRASLLIAVALVVAADAFTSSRTPAAVAQLSRRPVQSTRSLSMLFGGSGGGGAAGRVSSEIRSGVVLFTGSRDGASNKALSALDKIGCSYKVVQVDKEADGAEIRAELKKRTGITTLPFIFIKGQYVGGMSSGGPAGGLNGLMKGDMLQPMLEAAGAVKRSRLDSTPLAPLRGNNLRNALGSLGGGANPFGAPDQRR